MYGVILFALSMLSGFGLALGRRWAREVLECYQHLSFPDLGSTTLFLSKVRVIGLLFILAYKYVLAKASAKTSW